MKAIIRYYSFLHDSEFEIPLESRALDVPPLLRVKELKSKVCSETIFQEGRMVLVKPKKELLDKIVCEFGGGCRLRPLLSPYRISFGTEGEKYLSDLDSKDFRTKYEMLQNVELKKLAAERARMLVSALRSMQLDEELACEQAGINESEIFLSANIDWMKKCSFCGSDREFTRVQPIVGLGAVDDLSIDWKCSNSECNNSGVVSVRYAYVPYPMPLIGGLGDGQASCRRDDSQKNLAQYRSGNIDLGAYIERQLEIEKRFEEKASIVTDRSSIFLRKQVLARRVSAFADMPMGTTDCLFCGTSRGGPDWVWTTTTHEVDPQMKKAVQGHSCHVRCLEKAKSEREYTVILERIADLGYGQARLTIPITVNPLQNGVIIINNLGPGNLTDEARERFAETVRFVQNQGVGTVVRYQSSTGPFFDMVEKSGGWYRPSVVEEAIRPLLLGNLRAVLDFVLVESVLISGSEDSELYLVGLSEGASIAAAVAIEYPEATRVLLISPKGPLARSLSRFRGEVYVAESEDDPHRPLAERITDWGINAKSKKYSSFLNCEHPFTTEANTRTLKQIYLWAFQGNKENPSTGKARLTRSA